MEEPEDEIERAWAEEVRRRIAEHRAGIAKAIPWEEARKMIWDDTDDVGD